MYPDRVDKLNELKKGDIIKIVDVGSFVWRDERIAQHYHVGVFQEIYAEEMYVRMFNGDGGLEKNHTRYKVGYIGEKIEFEEAQKIIINSAIQKIKNNMRDILKEGE